VSGADGTGAAGGAAGTRGFRYGYVTNGLRDHALPDALALLAEHGYAGVALTLDHGHLDPFADDAAAQVAVLRRRLDDLGLAVVVETGARFLLDPSRKHEPTLVSPGDRSRRLELLRRAIAIAGELGAPVVSLWSGTAAPGEEPGVVWDRLLDGLAPIAEAAEETGVALGFEPEPGMVVADVAGFERLAADLGDPPALGITLDIGHCRCLEPEPPEVCVRRVADRLVHVQIEDMRRGVHEHLPFGEGEIDFPPVLAALAEIGYDGLVAVELSRHSHTAHTVVPESIAFLRAAEAATAAPTAATVTGSDR
jgi:L-ribulose-5-phosphate 3-epimerase